MRHAAIPEGQSLFFCSLMPGRSSQLLPRSVLRKSKAGSVPAWMTSGTVLDHRRQGVRCP